MVINKFLTFFLGALIVTVSFQTGVVAQAPATHGTRGAIAFGTVSDIPQHIQAWLYFEQVVNARNQGVFFSPLNFEALDRRYDPMNRPVWEIGYLEIPMNEAWFRYDSLSDHASKVLFFERDGKSYVRFFIHPMMEEKYRHEIIKYGLHRGTFLASPTASPRSLVVWNRHNPEEFVGQKVSLAVSVGELDRKVDIDQLERAFAINEVMKEVPESAKTQYGFDYLHEAMIQNTSTSEPNQAGKKFGNISRDLPAMVHPNGRPKYIPGFALFSVGPNGEDPRIVDLINRSGLPAETYLENYILKPLLQSYAYLTFEHGIIGEPHAQNVLFGSDENGNLNGHVIFRDLDGFKPDIGLRHLLGLSDIPFDRLSRPYKLLKMAKAQEFYRESYNLYIKDAWVTEFEGVFGPYKGKIQHWNVTNFAESLDKIFLLEAVRHLGFRAVFNSADMRQQQKIMEAETLWDVPENPEEVREARYKAVHGTLNEFVKNHKEKLKTLLPDVHWDDPLQVNLTMEQTEVLLKHFSVAELFLVKPKNDLKTWNFDVNTMVAAKKESSKSLLPEALARNGVSQQVLRREFDRLIFNYRSSSQKKLPNNAIFILNTGGITAYDKNYNVLNYAFLEPQDWLSGSTPFYQNAKYPRVEPDREILKALYTRTPIELSAELPPIPTVVIPEPETANEPVSVPEIAQDTQKPEPQQPEPQHLEQHRGLLIPAVVIQEAPHFIEPTADLAPEPKQVEPAQIITPAPDHGHEQVPPPAIAAAPAPVSIPEPQTAPLVEPAPFNPAQLHQTIIPTATTTPVKRPHFFKRCLMALMNLAGTR